MVDILPNVEDINNQNTQTCLTLCCECLSAVANVWCINCTADYCSSCWENVHKGRIISCHRQISINDKRKEDNRCNIHPHEKLQYWCNCDTLICLNCLNTKHHQYHISVPIVDAVQDITKQLKIEFNEIETCLNQTITQGKSLKNTNKNDNIEMISRNFDGLRKIIDNYEETLKNQVDQIDKKNKIFLENYLTLLNNKQTILSNQKKNLEYIILTNDYIQLFQVKGKLADYIVELTQQIEELKLPITIQYRIIGINHLQENLNDILKRIRIIEQKSENYEFAPFGTYKELDCKGRPCILCGKCRDWYYGGDLVSWDWILNHKDWKDNDWKQWNDNRIWEHFQRRDNATCLLSSSFHLFAACLCEDNI